MSRPEVWLRGETVAGVPALLQPVAHSLLQCLEEVRAVVPALDAEALRRRPGGAASCAYHLRHATGSLDRLTTYARGAMLDDAQLAALGAERDEAHAPDGAALLATFERQVDAALAQLRATDPATLADPRIVGRGRLPSTVIGLLFHAAEHTQRHVGQLATTAKIVASGE